MKIRALLFTLVAGLPVAAATPTAFNLFAASGSNPDNVHGHSSFRTISFELTFAQPRPLQRWRRLRDTEAGAAVSYHDIRQPRSWFGHRYGHPDDSARRESLFVFARHHWRLPAGLQPFPDPGHRPIWANPPLPARPPRPH